MVVCLYVYISLYHSQATLGFPISEIFFEYYVRILHDVLQST